MKYAEFDRTGKIVVFYSDDIHTPDQIPANTIPLSESEWGECVHFPGKWFVDIALHKLALNPAYSPDPSPAETKANMWGLIKGERDRRKSQGGVKVGTKWFHTEDASRIQQLGLVMIGASIPANLQWKTMDGSFVTMTQTLATQIFQASAANDMAIFAAAETHKAAMEASADPASYDFSQGWPKAFGEP